VNIQILEWQALLHQFIDKRKFEAIILGWGLGQEPDPYDIWSSDKTREGEFNFISYKNSKVDQLLVDGRRNCGQEKRMKIYHEIHALIAEDQPYTFLYYPKSLPILAKRFTGVKVTPIGIWWNFPRWKVMTR
jgi:peptide/nickel transport system substrate-binding protein